MKKFFILSAIILCPHIASAQSIWMHNKSEMLLEMRSNGDFIISYLTPREGLSAQPGDFVVYGSIDAKTNKANGIARLFSAKCGTTGYEIVGQMSQDKKTLTFKGTAPIRDGNCKITKSKEDHLVFTYVKERGSLDPHFIGEWSANQKTCNEEEAKEGPILTNISPRGYSAYETYCAFSQITGDTKKASVSMTCMSMGNKYLMTQDFIKKSDRIIEIVSRDGASAGAKQALYKCPIPFKNAASDPSTPDNLKNAEDEYFTDVFDKAVQAVKSMMYDEEQSKRQPRR